MDIVFFILGLLAIFAVAFGVVALAMYATAPRPGGKFNPNRDGP